jgi:hypothetical protein
MFKHAKENNRKEATMRKSTAGVRPYPAGSALTSVLALSTAAPSAGIDHVRVRVLPDGRMDRRNAAIYIGHAEKTLAEWATRGKGPRSIKVAGRIFYFQSDLDDFICSAPQATPGGLRDTDTYVSTAKSDPAPAPEPMNGVATEAVPVATSSVAKAGARGTALERKLRLPLAELGLPPRACNALVTDGLISVGDLVRKSAADVLGIPNIGRRSLDEIKRALARHKLRLGMEIAALEGDGRPSRLSAAATAGDC